MSAHGTVAVPDRGFKSIGQIAFEAFQESLNYRPEQRPQWSELTAQAQGHWEAAALAVVELRFQ